MHTLKNKIAIVSLFFCGLGSALTAQAHTQEILQFKQGMIGFVDYASPQSSRILFVSETGDVQIMQEDRLISETRFRVSHKECRPTSQNTVTMDKTGGMTLAYPFLVGTDRVCVFDENIKTLRLMSKFTTSLPRNTFSTVYAGTQGDEVYFLTNGRVFPDADSGYIMLLTINLKTMLIAGRELITEVPDYSGGMLFENNKIWVNTYPGRVFRILLTDLHQAIRQKKSVRFQDLAHQNYQVPGGALNSFVLHNKNFFLYYNDEYESYVVNRKTGFKYTVTPPCPPVSGRNDRWLILCRGQSLQFWTPARLE